MANVHRHFNYPTRVAEYNDKLYRAAYKLHHISSSIAFIKKALHHRVIQTFAKLRGKFLTDKHKKRTEMELMKSHIEEHERDLKQMMIRYNILIVEMKHRLGITLTKLLVSRTLRNSRYERLESLRTKNRKLQNLMKTTLPNQPTKECEVPIINLSDISLTRWEEFQLKKGLEHSFVDKHKNVKRYLATSFESLADRVKSSIENTEKENFHEFLREYTDIFSNNVYEDRDYTYFNLRRLKTNNDIVIIPGDKDSSVVVMNKTDYVMKMQSMIDEGITNGVYMKTEDDTLGDLRRFKDFLYRNFRNYKDYQKMLPQSNTPAQLYGTAKTHKFDNIDQVTIQELKFRPIIAQTGTYLYNTAQVISDYLKPLYEGNPFIIHNTQDFADMLKNSPPLGADEEYVSYDVESLFTNVPIADTITYILEQIYDHKKLPSICSRLIMRRLLEKLATESTFIFQSQFFKQTDGCTMGGPLSVTFSNIFLTKLESEKVQPAKPKFYKRFVDDVFNIRKKNVTDRLLEQLNSYHHRIKFTVEVNPEKFLDTRILHNVNGIETSVYRKPNKLPTNWSSKVPKRYKRNAINGDLYRASKIATDFNAEKETIKRKYKLANYPDNFVSSVIKDFEDKKELIIPPKFFPMTSYEKLPFVLIDVPFCTKNEFMMKHFLEKLNTFTSSNFDFAINWKTKKVRQLFSLKESNPYPACRIYEGQCNQCNVNYIGETVRNTQVRWSEHEDPDYNSEPARHIKANPGHSFTWRILCIAPTNEAKRKFLEASFIANRKPILNEQVDFKRLMLFRFGIT